MPGAHTPGREIGSLINSGGYNRHSYLGVTGQDLNYQIAQQEDIDITYGFGLITIVAGGPSDGKLQVDDVVIALNETLVRGNDDLASYLESSAQPNDAVTVTVFRDNSEVRVDVVLGTRPPPST